MKLTRTNRIIIAVAGVFVAFLLLLPPHRIWTQHEDGTVVWYVWEHDWVFRGDHLPTRVDLVRLVLEVAVVVVLAGALVVAFGRSGKPKEKRDKDA